MKKTWLKTQEEKVLKQMHLDAEKIVFGYGGKRSNAGRKKNTEKKLKQTPCKSTSEATTTR